MTAIDLDALARHLGVPYSQLRTTGSKVILIAGSRGNVKSIGQHLVIAIRDSAIGKEVELRQTLIDCGLLISSATRSWSSASRMRARPERCGCF